MYLKKLKIGNVELDSNILLAPMAGVTDKAFRMICKDYGAGLVCTEMISSKGLYYNDEKTKILMDVENEKRPIAVQIFGNDPEIMASAAKYVEKYADIIDINMGCPAPKIVKNPTNKFPIVSYVNVKFSKSFDNLLKICPLGIDS